MNNDVQRLIRNQYLIWTVIALLIAVSTTALIFAIELSSTRSATIESAVKRQAKRGQANSVKIGHATKQLNANSHSTRGVLRYLQGKQGLSGVPGKGGKLGAPGPPGIGGQRGSTGASGKSGQNGGLGASGKPGQNGVQGTSGAKGDTGAKGDIGANGDTGSSGSPGANGQDGAQGPPGPQGNPGTGVSSFTFTYLGMHYTCTPSSPGSQDFTCTSP